MCKGVALGFNTKRTDSVSSYLMFSNSKMPSFTPSCLIFQAMILHGPSTLPEGITGSTAYEIGCCLQLDREHCLQGGGALVAGNDASVFSSLADIRSEKAVTVNRGVSDSAMPDGRGLETTSRSMARTALPPARRRLVSIWWNSRSSATGFRNIFSQ